MAMLTSGTYLKYQALTGSPTTWTPLCEIKNYPDLGSAPSKHDTTTLSAKKYKTGINGLMEAPEFQFETNYDFTDYKRILALTDKYKFKLEFGDDGEDGAWGWNGEITIYPTGGEVDGVRQMTVIVSAETEITPIVA